MKAKELLTIVTGTGYSKSTMQKLFNAANNEKEAERVAELIRKSKTEKEVLEALERLQI